MRIAVYSGSFDPLHIGHLQIMRLLSSDPAFDCTYLVVSPRNPLKPEGKEANASERLLAAEAAVRRHPELNVKVDDIEMSMPAPHWTCRTLDALREREPENTFTLVIGGDNLRIFREWRDYQRILLEYGVVVFPRTGAECEELKASLLEETPLYRIRIADAPAIDVSSTQIRESAPGEADDLLM